MEGDECNISKATFDSTKILTSFILFALEEVNCVHTYISAIIFMQ
jgi:hypothetical protein